MSEVEDEAYSEAMEEIDWLKSLISRAAEALEYWNDLPDSRAKFLTLIAELRKAATE